MAVAGALLACSGFALSHAPPTVAASTYAVTPCDGPSPTLNDGYGGWTSFHSVNVPGVDAGGGCAGGMTASIYTGPSGHVAPLGTGVGWRFDAPSGTYVVGVAADLLAWLRVYQTPDAAQYDQGLLQVYANGLVTTYSPADNHSLNGGTHVSFAGLHSPELDFRLLCDGPAGDDGCFYSTGNLVLSNTHVTLGDDNDPSVASATGAATTDAVFTGTKRLAYAATDGGGGVARFRLYVDGHPIVDHVADNRTGHCEPLGNSGASWVFDRSLPCPTSVNTTESIDTTQIADGQHIIEARVVDAAQREATVISREGVVVANHPPVNSAVPAYERPVDAGTPQIGTAIAALSDGTWTGPSLTVVRSWVQCDANGTVSSCAPIPGATGLSYVPTAGDLGHRLRLAVTATNAAASVTVYSAPTGIVTQPSSAEVPTPKPEDGSDGHDGANGTDAPPTLVTALIIPTLPSVTNTTTIAHTLRGRVAGSPEGVACPEDRATLKFEHVKGGQMALGFGKSSTAQVQLTCTVSGKAIAGAQLDISTKTGREAAVAADVATDGAGHATLRLAKGASRAIAVGYRMYADDPIARATATLKVLVNSKVSLKANHRTLRNGHAVQLRGSLGGGLIPKRGVNLSMQWKDGKRWRPFAQIKSNRKGVFSYAYRFTRSNRPVTYALRAQVVKGQVDYPFVGTASKAVKVTVAP
ncbi:MAG TPA: hypothetical protein VGM33_14880 [Baekduia sp.]|jgi:hypothetical protein